jgi:hypothetical protein
MISGAQNQVLLRIICSRERVFENNLLYRLVGEGLVKVKFKSQDLVVTKKGYAAMEKYKAGL